MNEPEAPLWTSLTAREAEVANALAKGLTNQEIAKALGLSVKTIDTHRGHVMQKLKCKNNVGLVLLMMREGRLTP